MGRYQGWQGTITIRNDQAEEIACAHLGRYGTASSNFA